MARKEEPVDPRGLPAENIELGNLLQTVWSDDKVVSITRVTREDGTEIWVLEHS